MKYSDITQSRLIKVKTTPKRLVEKIIILFLWINQCQGIMIIVISNHSEQKLSLKGEIFEHSGRRWTFGQGFCEEIQTELCFWVYILIWVMHYYIVCCIIFHSFILKHTLLDLKVLWTSSLQITPCQNNNTRGGDIEHSGRRW